MTITRHMPPTVYPKWDQPGAFEIRNKYPTPDRVVTPDDADYADVAAMADAWRLFCQTHNAANGAPTVLSRTKITGPVVIGWVELTKGMEFTQYYEYAAYWTTIWAEPQTVTMSTDGDRVYFGFTGKITGGGRNIDYDNKAGVGVGTDYTVTQSPYTYDVDDVLDSDQVGNALIFTVDDDKLAAWVADRTRIIEAGRERIAKNGTDRHETWNWTRVHP